MVSILPRPLLNFEPNIWFKVLSLFTTWKFGKLLVQRNMSLSRNTIARLARRASYIEHEAGCSSGSDDETMASEHTSDREFLAPDTPPASGPRPMVRVVDDDSDDDDGLNGSDKSFLARAKARARNTGSESEVCEPANDLVNVTSLDDFSFAASDLAELEHMGGQSLSSVSLGKRSRASYVSTKRRPGVISRKKTAAKCTVPDDDISDLSDNDFSVSSKTVASRAHLMDLTKGPNARARRFTMTLNNYTEDEVKWLKSDAFDKFCKYRCFGVEVGENGTPHLQVYMETNYLTISGLQKAITKAQGFPSRYACFISKGNGAQNVTYCSKDGDFWETGEPPKGQGKRSDLAKVADAIKSGKSLKEIATEHTTSFIKYPAGIKAALSLIKHDKRTTPTLGYWCHGPTGSGKSRWANAISGIDNTYSKMPKNKWWEFYNQEETVIIDDYRPNAELCFTTLLRLTDRYPMPIENKNGSGQFNSKRVIITSPVDIDQAFSHLDWMKDGSLDQLKRRFVQLEFGPGKLSHHLKLSDLPRHPVIAEEELSEETSENRPSA